MMTKVTAEEGKKIPRSILIIGAFQVAAGLWAISSMAITSEWDLVVTLLAICYTILGAGLLAVMEWARFIGVVIHVTFLPLLFWRLYNDHAGLNALFQVGITMFILFILTRPHIRAKFRRESYPSTN